MTIAAIIAPNTFTGDANHSAYDFDFKITSQSDLTVIVSNASGIEYDPLVITTDYTVSGVNDPDGGTITFVNASQAWLTAGKLKTGYGLMIRDTPSAIQGTRIRDEGTFYASTHEAFFDRVTRVIQSIFYRTQRAVRLRDTIDPADFDPLLPEDIVGAESAIPLTNSSGDGWADADDWLTLAEFDASVAAAASSASAASSSASAAATSASASATSASASATSASASATSASSAASSATAAASSATAAAASAAIAAAASGYNINSSRASPQLLANSAAISFTAGYGRNKVYIAGNGGAVTGVTIQAGTINGQELLLQGRHATNTVLIDFPSGQILFDATTQVTLNWDGTEWNVCGRSN